MTAAPLLELNSLDAHEIQGRAALVVDGNCALQAGQQVLVDGALIEIDEVIAAPNTRRRRAAPPTQSLLFRVLREPAD